MINGVTSIIMTKSDILDGLDELNVCNGYQVNGEEKNYIPFQMNKLPIEPVYKGFEGWKTDISAVKQYAHLPLKMKEYIGYLNEYLQVPVKYISNGPGRDQLIIAD